VFGAVWVVQAALPKTWADWQDLSGEAHGTLDQEISDAR
jgi:hypothetical protein